MIYRQLLWFTMIPLTNWLSNLVLSCTGRKWCPKNQLAITGGHENRHCSENEFPTASPSKLYHFGVYPEVYLISVWTNWSRHRHETSPVYQLGNLGLLLWRIILVGKWLDTSWPPKQGLGNVPCFGFWTSLENVSVGDDIPDIWVTSLVPQSKSGYDPFPPIIYIYIYITL